MDKMNSKYLVFMVFLPFFQALSQNVGDTVISLGEVIVEAHSKRNIQMQSPQNVLHIPSSFIRENFAGSLMQSLEKIPGISAMNIGSGQSKPTIRGLGFNRMLVAENGVKHEGQQWGEDHGLEIDQFALDNVEIIKGPGALFYGSDAVAGVINLKSSGIPQKNFEGEINLFGRTNNESAGLSARWGGRKNGFWYRANFTLIDYADYRIPADSIQYYSYYIKLKNRRLRNTAGKEHNGSISSGYRTGKFTTAFHLSDTYTKSGFFANAHGLEVRLSDIDYDRSRRDIDLPRHSVNHFKATSHTTYTSENVMLETDLAFQNNFRQEFSEPVSHGYMPVPTNTTERQFDKNTVTAKIGAWFSPVGRHNLGAGIDFEHQNNSRAGWGFIIPDFTTAACGTFFYDKWRLSDRFIMSGGIRFDRLQTNIREYRDWYVTPDENGTAGYKLRAPSLQRTLHAITWSLGLNYDRGPWNFKTGVGKSFRAPIPKELGSDGVNYHIFRYEKGNAGLSPEQSYQLDAGVNLNRETFNIQIEPYINYFPNFICLNPTSGYYEGLQMYYYTQSRVLRWGFEFGIHYNIIKQVELTAIGDYLYARQLSGSKKGYTLPFSPPPGITLGVKFLPKAKWAGKDASVSLDFRAVAAQNEIVPPENTTAAYHLLNATLGRTFEIKAKHSTPFFIKAALQVNNLLNRRYYNHTGFYRLIDVPEAGRNFSIMLGFNF
jgi:iron complex outermembrane receptor protein